MVNIVLVSGISLHVPACEAEKCGYSDEALALTRFLIIILLSVASVVSLLITSPY